MKRAFLSIFCIAIAAVAFADPKGEEIARKYFDLKKAEDTKATAVMTLIDKSGGRKIRTLEMYSQESKEGKNTYFVFSQPADVAGTKFLTLSHQGSDSEQRLYLPALKKVRRISSSGKDGEFVNSDFFFYDLEERYFEDNAYTYISENETIADKAFDGMKFYKIELKPKDISAPYSRSIAYFNMTDNFLYKMECFDKKDDALLKTILFVKVENMGGVLISTQIIAVNNKKGTKTLLALNDVRINSGLKAELFSVKNLEQ